MAMKMPYHTWDVLSATQYDSMFLRGNGPWDPEVSSGGNQPPNWDDIANLYYEYVCVGSKCSVTFMNEGLEYVNVCLQAVQGDGVFSPGSFEMFNQENIKIKTLAPQVSGSRNTCTISMFKSTARMMGKDPLNSAELSSVVTTLPSTRWTWVIGAFDRTTTDVSINVKLEVHITYYVIFRKRINNLADDS